MLQSLRRSKRLQEQRQRLQQNRQEPMADAQAANSSSAAKPRFCCDVCLTPFTRRDNLKTHIKTQHGNESKYKFWCRYKDCAIGLTTRHNWKQHELTHAGVKKFICDLCGAGFSQKAHLARHNKSVHWCNHCDLTVADKKAHNAQAHPKKSPRGSTTYRCVRGCNFRSPSYDTVMHHKRICVVVAKGKEALKSVGSS